MAVRAQSQHRVERRTRIVPRLTETRDAYLFLLPGLIILLGFVAYPFLDGIATSMTNRGVARPVNTFVAGFVGSPAINLLPAEVVSDGSGAALQGEGWGYPLSALNARRAQRSSSREVVVGARHRTIEVHTDARPGAVPGRVYTVEPTGDVTYAHVYLGSTIVVVSVAPGLCLAADDRVWIDFDQARLHLFDGRTEQALTADA